MKILFIAHEGGNSFNGASRSLIGLIKCLSQNHDIYLVVPSQEGRLFAEATALGCKIFVFDYKRWVVQKTRNISKWYLAKACWYIRDKRNNDRVVSALVDIIRQNKIDIVHSNSSVINIGVEAAQRAGVQHVWHIREFAKEDFNMYPVCSDKYYRDGLNRPGVLIAISKAVKEKYQKFVSQDKIRVVYNGIELREKKENVQKNNDSFNILITGMILKSKGQHIAVEAVQKLIDKGYNRVHLYIAGKGNLDVVAPKWKRTQENIHALGLVDNMYDLREKMDVEVVCSKAEAFGRVTAEAMAMGLPVIGSNSGGTPELIQEGKNGFLFDIGNSELLAKKIEFLILNPDLRDEMSRNALDYVVRNFNIEDCAKRIENIYYELL